MAFTEAAKDYGRALRSDFNTIAQTRGTARAILATGTAAAHVYDNVQNPWLAAGAAAGAAGVVTLATEPGMTKLVGGVMRNTPTTA